MAVVTLAGLVPKEKTPVPLISFISSRFAPWRSAHEEELVAKGAWPTDRSGIPATDQQESSEKDNNEAV